MSTTHRTSRFIALPADVLWSRMIDIGALPQWQPLIASAEVHGEVREGVAFDWVPNRRGDRVHRRAASPARVSAFVPNQTLAFTLDQPACATTVRWDLIPADEDLDRGTTVQQTVSATGPAAPIYDRLLARRFAAEADTSLARLALAAGGAQTANRQTTKRLRVVIAGGTGALGQRIAADLTCRGHEVVILTRGVRRDLPYRQVEWDGRSVGAWATELDGPNVAVVNLAGKLVDCRPTARNIADLTTSRVQPTRALVAAAKKHRVERWIQASTTAVWSDAGEIRCTEQTPVPDPGLPQMTGVARPWEEAAAGVNSEHVTVLRTSIVLDPAAPAMERMVGVTKAFAGGRLGTGRQWFSWIHLDDWLAIVRAALGLDPTVTLPDGVVVAAAPTPVRNAELMRGLRRHLHRPPAPPTPPLLLNLGAAVMRSDPALGLTGRHATSDVLEQSGFEFRFDDLDGALTDIFGA